MKLKPKYIFIGAICIAVAYLLYKNSESLNVEKTSTIANESQAPSTITNSYVPKGYNILLEDTTESTGLAQLAVLAILNDSTEKNSIKQNYLYDIYDKVKDFNNKKENFMAQLDIDILLYSSKKTAKKDRLHFDMRLRKIPVDSIPVLSNGPYNKE